MATGRDSSVKDSDYVRAASVQELKARKQMRVRVEDRVVALFYVKGKIYAVDHFCYHTGGPLSLGDIEDADGRPCVICPWHKHKITLDTGESLYTAIDPMNPRNIRPNCSKGVRQRTHHVRVERDDIMVKLSDRDQELESDRYFTEPYRVFIENSLKAMDGGLDMKAVKVPIHSTRTW